MKTETRVVLVTGGARRVGAGIVEALADDGWRVLVHCHRSVAEADALIERLTARGVQARRLRADLADDAAIERLARQALEAFGRLDGLVNNASSYFPTPIAQLDAAALDTLLASNLRAPALLCARLAPQMAEGGSIINIVDSQLHRAVANYPAYSAAKAGLLQLSRNLARDLAPRLRVNSVAPGHILWAENNSLDEDERRRIVQRLPMQRLGEPAEIGAAVRFLMSDAARYITGVNLPVDGGLSLL